MLTIKDCKDIMNTEILIGTSEAKDGLIKRFKFNPWMNEYSIFYDGHRIDSDTICDRLLEKYNEL